MELNVEDLKKAGLTGNESKVYFELLKKGELSANELAKKIGMDRTLVYTVLNNLVEKGMVSYIIKENKKLFSAANPENLLSKLKEKEAFIQDLIPKLKSIKKFVEPKQEIKVYEGKEGLRVFVNLAIKEKFMYSFGATGQGFYAFYDMPLLVKKAIKKKMDVRMIANKKLKGISAFSFKAFKIKYLDIQTKVTTSIFGDYVSIHIVKDKPLVIIIKNKDIAESYKNYFNVLWAAANF